MKCKRDGCSNEAQGRSQYCSESCKTVHNRNKRQAGPEPEHALNPLAVPGDPDYVGVCYQDEQGVWHVSKDKPDVKGMTTDELIRRLHYIKDWQRNPEHQEVLRRRAA